MVLNHFCQKPMAKSFCLMEASAIGENTKWSTLSQEIIRLMKNTSQRACKTIHCEIITDFMEKLQRSDYLEEIRNNCHEGVQKDGEE